MPVTSRTFRRIGEKIPQLITEHFDVSKQIIAAEVTNNYMVDAGVAAKGTPNPSRGPGTLRIVTARLARSFVNAADARAGGREGVSNITFSGDSATMVYGTKVPYAKYHVNSRPYLDPAVDATVDELDTKLSDSFQKMILEEIDKDNR